MFHVLVIDDDEQMQFFLNEALRRQGYAVTLRKTAEEGLQVLKSDAAGPRAARHPAARA